MKELSIGDIFYRKPENLYEVYKILKIDRKFNIYHVKLYKSIDFKPTEKDIDKLELAVMHIPIGSFDEYTIIGNQEVTKNDLEGYNVYMEMMKEQDEEFENITEKANKLFKEAYYLSDADESEKSIEKYSEAIELIPNFFEAIDNRAFVKMDLSQWEDAIEDFELSLTVNPNSYLAIFSIGECYFRLKNYEKAKIQFEKAIEIDPEQEIGVQFLEKTNEYLNK